MSNPLTAVQLADNPVGLWVLGESSGATTAVNQGSSGAAFNGTIGANVTMGAPGKFSGTTAAFFTQDFSNPNPTVSPTNSTSFASVIKTARDTGNAHGLQPTGDFSLECLVSWDFDNSNDNDYSILAYGWNSEGANSGTPYSLFLSDTYALSARLDVSGTTTCTSSYVVSDATFAHVVMRYTSSAQTIELFVSGTKVGTQNGIVSPITYADTNSTYSVDNPGLIIGGGWQLFNGTFQGWMQNVAVYGAALSDARITAHASAAAGTGGSDSGGNTPTPIPAPIYIVRRPK